MNFHKYSFNYLCFRNHILFVALFCFSILNDVSADDSMQPALAQTIDEARQHAISFGNRHWPNYENTPFGFLLTRPEQEVLLCHGSKAPGFKELSTEKTTGCLQQVRDSVFPMNLLAAMPVVQGKSTIVMGTPGTTGKSLAAWTHTIFHEHFHQYQTTFPAYYQRLHDLGLHNGDTTGMWMLNYPFPYQKAAFIKQFNLTSKALYEAATSSSETIEENAEKYLKARERLARSVSELDWRYFEMQLWNEGVARFSEIEVALDSSSDSVVASAMALKKQSLKALRDSSLAKMRREIVYPFGMAEAILLERCTPDWRADYVKHLAMGPMVNAIKVSKCDRFEKY